jgi:hypothetical protein
VPVFGAADLDALLAQLGVSVLYGGATVNGLLDQEDVLETDGGGFQVAIRRQVVRVKTGALAALSVNSAITVDGNPYHIREVRLEGDGAYTAITLVTG